MKASPILSPQGEPVFIAGGPDAHSVTPFKEWVVSLEWARRGRRFLRVMVIWPAPGLQLLGAPKPGQWCITESALFQMVGFKHGKVTGGPSEYLFEQALEALPLLGRDVNDKASFVSLVDTVVHFAPELVMIPAAPRSVREKLTPVDKMWDMTKANKKTGKVLEETSV